MKPNKWRSFLSSSLLITGVLLVVVYFLRQGNAFKGPDFVILILIILTGIVAMIMTFKKEREKEEGQPAEDELTLFLKYKAGYKAYMASMYMWLFIFLLRDKFPNVESMVGGGVLLSAVIFFLMKFTVKKEFHE